MQKDNRHSDNWRLITPDSGDIRNVSIINNRSQHSYCFMFICLKYFQLLEIVSLSVFPVCLPPSPVLNNRPLSLIITLICVSPIIGRSLINTRSWKLALNLSVILQSVVCDLRVSACVSQSPGVLITITGVKKNILLLVSLSLSDHWSPLTPYTAQWKT